MRQSDKLTTGHLVKKMAGLVTHLIPHYVAAVTCAVLGFLTTLLIPALLIQLTWQALGGQRPTLFSLCLLVVLGLSRGIFRYGEHYFGHYVAFRTLADFRNMVFAKLRRLAPAKLDRQDSGLLLKMIGEDIEAMEVFFAHTLPPIATALVTSLILLTYFLTLSPWIALVALVTYALLAIFLPQIFASRLQPLLQGQSQSRKTYLSLFSDSLRGMRDLLQTQQVKHRLDRLSQTSQLVNQAERQVAQTSHQQTAATFLIIGLAICAQALIFFGLVDQGQLSLERAVIGLLVFISSFAPYLELSRLPLGFKRAINAGREVFDLLEEVELERDGQTLSEPLTAIQVTDLTFAYEGREQTVFDQLSQSFEPNQIIGLVGQSGSGKSTLMKLIMRWYQAQSGQIRLNGQDIQTLSARSIQDRIAYIPQIPQIFSQTIRENLVLGRGDISDETILAMADKCRIKEKILACSQGLDTPLNREQKIFSAGELQRLELTRAMLKQADCYIFDEPTSNLDSLNEAALLQVIREHCRGYVFLISHRSSTVAISDCLYELEQGQLIRRK